MSIPIDRPVQTILTDRRRPDVLTIWREPDKIVEVDPDGTEWIGGPNDWRWTLKSGANGKILGASSEGYRKRIDCVKSAARVLDIYFGPGFVNGEMIYRHDTPPIRVVIA